MVDIEENKFVLSEGDESNIDNNRLRNYENKEKMGAYMREHKNLSWAKLSFWDRAKLINKFSFIIIVGNIVKLYEFF